MREVRSGPLCWAQHWFWLSDHILDSGVIKGRMMHTDVAIPDGIPVATVRRALARLVNRHEALRTVYRRGPDGSPIQVVLDDCEPHTLVVDVDDADRYRIEAGFEVVERVDLAKEPAVVVVIGVRDELARRVHVTIHRMSADGAAAQVIHDELRELLHPGRAEPVTEQAEPVWQPIDQAALEASDKASGAADRSGRFWENELATGAHASVPVYWESNGASTYLTSVYLGAAKLRTVAQRQGVTVPTVVQALLALVCSAWTGHASVAFGTVTANRVRKAAKASVGRYASMVRVVLPVDQDLPFAAYLKGIHHKLFVAYYHAHHDLGEMIMREIRHSARIGARMTPSIFFEYHDYLRAGRLPAAATQSEAPLIVQKKLTGHVPQLRFDFYPHAAAFELAMRCPSTLLDDAAAKAFLTQFHGVVERVAAADAPVAELLKLVNLPAVWANGGWARVREAWVSLDDLARLLMQHPDVASAIVSVEPSGAAGDARLVAHVVPRSAALSVEDLDDYLRDVVSHHPSTMVPARYDIGEAPPGSGSSLDRPPPTDGRNEELLADVFRACHAGRSVQMADCYAEAGGEFFRIPDMLDRIAQAGLEGLSWRDLVGFASMRTLARKLTRNGEPGQAGSG